MFTLCQSATAVCHLLEKVRVGVVFVVGEAFADLEVAVLGLAHDDRAEEHSLQDLASRLGKFLRVRAAPDARQTQPLAALNTDRQSSRGVGERYSHHRECVFVMEQMAVDRCGVTSVCVCVCV